jgi:hypothetical protein
MKHLPGDVPTFLSVLGTEQLDQLGLKSGIRSGTYKNLLGLDMSKPEDVEKARAVAVKAQSNKYLSDEQKQKVIDIINQGVVAAGGTPIDLTSVTKKDEKQVPPTGTKPPEDVSQTGPPDVNAALAYC